MKSPVYWSPTFHEILKKIIRRKKKSDIHKRLQEVCKWIPEKSSVIDVAAGTSRIYREMLRGFVGSYIAVEINLSFVKYLKGIGIEAIQMDIRKEPLPKADIVVMMAAMYHFKDQESEILDKLLGAARLRVIIVEPIGSSLQESCWRDRLKAKLADIGEGPIYYRIEKERLLKICEDRGKVEYHAFLPNNEFMVVIKGNGH